MQKDDRIFAIVGACVVAAVAVGAALMWLNTGITVDVPQRASVAALTSPTPMPKTSVVPAAQTTAVDPVGNDEIAMVRRAVAGLSSHPGLAAMLVNDRLLTRFVMAVDAVAGGYSPRDQIDFLRPQRPFLVREDEGRLIAASGSFHRYDMAVEVFDSIDIGAAADLYKRLRPRLDEIYREIGWTGGDFDLRFQEAFVHLLDVEHVEGSRELEQRAVVYAYADERIEQLSGAQKQLLRLGPTNTAKVLNRLHELWIALGWPEPGPDDVTTAIETDVVTMAIADPIALSDIETDRTGAVEAP